jgi:hypothetical protein
MDNSPEFYTREVEWANLVPGKQYKLVSSVGSRIGLHLGPLYHGRKQFRLPSPFTPGSFYTLRLPAETTIRFFERNPQERRHHALNAFGRPPTSNTAPAPNGAGAGAGAPNGAPNTRRSRKSRKSRKSRRQTRRRRV